MVAILAMALVFVVVFVGFPTNAQDSRSRTTVTEEIDTERLLLNRLRLSLPPQRRQSFFMCMQTGLGSQNWRLECDEGQVGMQKVHRANTN